MTGYQLLFIVHVLAATIWVGGGVVIVVMLERAERTGNRVGLAGDLQWVGPRVGAPSSLAVLGTGVAMVLLNPAWAFGHTWIWITLLIFAASFAIGAGFHGPQFKRIAGRLEAEGPDDPQLHDLVRRSFFVTRVEVGLLVLGLLTMLIKPRF